MSNALNPREKGNRKCVLPLNLLRGIKVGHIYFNVPMIEQGDNPICWIACVAMLTSVKKHASQGIDKFTGGFDPSNSCIPDPNGSWDDLYKNLKKFGFETTGANSCIDPEFIEQMLRRYGPFMIFVYAADFPFSGPFCLNMQGNPQDTHAVIVSGVDTRTGKVEIVNPWGTNVPPVDIDVVIGLVQQIADSGLDPIAFLR